MLFWNNNELTLNVIKRSNTSLVDNMKIHYSQPKGFVGRNICYMVTYNGVCYGHIVGGSATMHLPGRNEYFGNAPLNSLVNNIFFHIEKQGDDYPIRNFAQKTIKLWRFRVSQDWKLKYGDNVVGFETLVEPPRTGECYLRDKWVYTGTTKGFTCKRPALQDGMKKDKYGNARIWNKDPDNLRPKLVFVRKNIC